MPVKYNKKEKAWFMGSKKFKSKASALKAYRAYLYYKAHPEKKN